jgi:DNA-binding CsgD family transcriptional regulator
MSAPRAALTRSEERIVQLAAAGLSNPEVADELGISRQTVEWHLWRAYRKLGTQSETIVVRGTSATGGGTSWELTDGDPCAAGPNRFGLVLTISEVSLRVGAANRTLVTLAPGGTVTRNVRILMACSGSAGAGSTLTTQLVLTATA